MTQGYTKGFPVDVDPLLEANSHFLVPSQAAIKSYVASYVGAANNAAFLGGIPASSYVLDAELVVVWDEANAAYVQANTARTHANNSYAAANGAYDAANASYGQANTATTIGNAAYGTANLAYSTANTADTVADAAFGQANTARTGANTAGTIANSAFGQANTARTHANNAYAAANAAYGTANSGVIIGNAAYNTANLAYDAANNATDTWVRTQANTAYTIANAAYDQANSATTIASAAYDQANTGGGSGPAFDQANAAYTQANSAYSQANTGITIGSAAFDQANSASEAKANVSAVGPVGPTEGVLWWNEDTGRLLVYYDDGSSQQWVDASPDSGTPGPTGPVGPFGPKSVTIAYPTASEDLTLIYTNQSVLITKISAVLRQSAASNVQYTLRKSSDRNATGTEIVTGGMFCNSNTTANTYWTFDSPTVPTNTFLWLETTGVTGSVQEFHLTIEFE